MSGQDPRHTALRQAVRAGTPYAYARGMMVVLVLSAQRDPLTGKVGGQVIAKECASAGLAKAVRDRVLLDLQAYPAFAGRILDVSEQLALQALRPSDLPSADGEGTSP